LRQLTPPAAFGATPRAVVTSAAVSRISGASDAVDAVAEHELAARAMTAALMRAGAAYDNTEAQAQERQARPPSRRAAPRLEISLLLAHYTFDSPPSAVR